MPAGQRKVKATTRLPGSKVLVLKHVVYWRRSTQARIRGKRRRQPLRTVSRVLRRAGLSRFSALAPVDEVQRYEREAPGDLLHIDIKKLGSFPMSGIASPATTPSECGVWATSTCSSPSTITPGSPLPLRSALPVIRRPSCSPAGLEPFLQLAPAAPRHRLPASNVPNQEITKEPLDSSH